MLKRKKKSPRRSKIVPVRISVDPHSGILQCVPEVVYIQRGDGVQWVTDEGESLTIQSIAGTPFDKTEYHFPPNSIIQVRTDAEPGAYRFASAVTFEGSVYMDARCPRLIIDL